MHQTLAGRAVAQSDREEDLHREVDVQRLQREERHPAGDGQQARTEERSDEPEQGAHLEADVAHQVVVQGPAKLDSLDDRREVVVGQDHDRGLLRDLGAGDPHRDADVGLLEGGCIVHAVARHGDDVALALENVDQVHLVLGRHARDDADVIDLASDILWTKRREVCPGDRSALDPELARDGFRRHGVVAGDHPDLDARSLRDRDRRLRLGTGRIDDADQREECQVVHERQQVRRIGVEGCGIEVAHRGRHDPKALAAQPFVLGQVLVTDLRDRNLSATSVLCRGRAREQLIGSALDIDPDHVPASVVLHLVKGRHELVSGIERNLGQARVALAGQLGIDAALGGEHHQGALGRVADDPAVPRDRVGAQGHWQ